MRAILGTATLAACAGSGGAGAGHSERRHPGSQAPGLHSSFGAIWDDAGRCDEAVRAGRRRAKASGMIRVASWNIKWFPDMRTGTDAAPAGRGTDVPWVGCALAALDADVIALQEVKLTPRGHEALAELVKRLDALTGGVWAWTGDDCEIPSRQHLVFLHRRDRVSLDKVVSHAEIDPTADGKVSKTGRRCVGQLRPALAAYVRSLKGGLDFHVVNLHLDSGVTDRDFGNRRQAWERLPALLTARRALEPDTDTLVIGDFNSMGCPTCGVETADQELAQLAQTLGGSTTPLRSLPPQPRCSAYYKGKGSPLDHLAVNKEMREAERTVLQSAGVCERASCAELSEELPVFKRLTDHCPVVADIRDVDDD